MSEYYYPDGRPILGGVLEWAKFMDTDRMVAVTRSWDWRKEAPDEQTGVLVSTVYLGLDHSFGEGPPLIYETMVFGGDHNGDMDRYTTYEEALEGHKRMEKQVFGDPMKKVTRRIHDPREAT